MTHDPDTITDVTQAQTFARHLLDHGATPHQTALAVGERIDPSTTLHARTSVYGVHIIRDGIQVASVHMPSPRDDFLGIEDEWEQGYGAYSHRA